MKLHQTIDDKLNGTSIQNLKQNRSKNHNKYQFSVISSRQRLADEFDETRENGGITPGSYQIVINVRGTIFDDGLSVGRKHFGKKPVLVKSGSEANYLVADGRLERAINDLAQDHRGSLRKNPELFLIDVAKYCDKHISRYKNIPL